MSGFSDAPHPTGAGRRTIIVEYDEDSTFAHVLLAVQEHTGHRDDSAQAIIDATTLYAIQKGLPPFKK